MPIPAVPPQGDAQLNDNARTVIGKRYLIKDVTGTPVEQPEDMFWRVAGTVAEADRRYGSSDAEVTAIATEFYRLMVERRFEPNSPTLMNAGRPLGQLSACFVLPVEDALSNGRDGIYDTLRSMALIHQSGGGTGFGFSKLRGMGSMVRSTTGVASGPVSFMKLYDASTDAVKQGGTRRGANMGILRVDHPDIMDFITCKEDLTQITNFNISVAVTDKFMDAVKAGTSYDLVDPSSSKVIGQLDARTVPRRSLRGHESVLIAAAPSIRRLQPWLDQRRLLRERLRDGLERAEARHPSFCPFSRQHHRCQQVSVTRDRCAVEEDPPHWFRHYGIRRRAGSARYCLQHRRGG